MAKQQNLQTNQTFLPETEPQNHQTNYAMHQKTYGKAVRWLTGHCFLNRHTNLLDPYNNPDPLCRHCKEEEETPWHIIARCGAFQHIRIKHFNLHELPDNFEWEGHDLINFLKDPSIDLMEDEQQQL